VTFEVNYWKYKMTDVGQAAHDDAVTVFIEGDRNSYGQPMAGPRFERTAPSTLFGRGYNVTFFDEAHCARKYNKVHTAARGLQERSHLMVAMTAMPVTTKPPVSHSEHY
jgi:hypothetical protein